MQIWAESGKSALPICNYSQILYQFLTFTQNLKRSHGNPLLCLEFTGRTGGFIFLSIHRLPFNSDLSRYLQYLILIHYII